MKHEKQQWAMDLAKHFVNDFKGKRPKINHDIAEIIEFQIGLWIGQGRLVINENTPFMMDEFCNESADLIVKQLNLTPQTTHNG